MPQFAVVGFYAATEEADIALHDAEDGRAAAAAHAAGRRQTDRRLLPDWLFVAVLEAATGTPVLANLGAEGIGPGRVTERPGDGAPFLVLGLLVSTGAAHIVRLRRTSALAAVEAVLEDDVGDFQFVCALDAAGRVVHTVENFDRASLARAAEGSC